MIWTVTLNASIDKMYLLPAIQPETVMRVREAVSYTHLHARKTNRVPQTGDRR